MPDHDLTRLSPRNFEQLTVALAHRALGAGVEAFGDGPDGGREATFEGTIRWSKTAAGGDGEWSGFVVLQAKFLTKRKATPHQEAVWLQQQVAAEIDRWAIAAREGTRSRLPDYLIFVTNADLSAVAKTGGIDTLTEFVRTRLDAVSDIGGGLVVRDFRIWHGAQLRTLLDAHPDVHWQFPALLTVGDILAAQGEQVRPLGTMDLTDPLRQQLVRALADDRWVRFNQAGGPGDAKLHVDDIAVDVPALRDDDARPLRAIRHILGLGDTVLRPRQLDRIRQPHVVVVGGPGQGKTTISQVLAQAYRAAMLADTDLGPDATAIINAMRVALDRMGLFVPNNRRWPFRVDLAAYAEELASGADRSLLRWIADKISERIEQTVTALQLQTWLQAWPWVLLLDGLDEVPSTTARRLVYARLSDLLSSAEDFDADLLVVVTTRPTGYDERLPAHPYRHLRLGDLPPAEAAALSKRITDLRFGHDDVQRERVAERMRAAVEDPVSARLMRTPLQVTIMSMIVEKYPTLPPNRFTLFTLYYDTVTDREIARDLPISKYLSTHRQEIDRLHERVGLLLQIESESAPGAEALLSPEALHAAAKALLVARGYTPEQAATDASTLVDAALLRLVLLAPRGDGIGFEVRSLQEFMAARALLDGEGEDVRQRLALTAPSPHWRNTWLLAAGGALHGSERFQKHLLNLLSMLDAQRALPRGRFPHGPVLAAEMIDDNLGQGSPAFSRELTRRVLTAVDTPPVSEIDHIAQVLNMLADSGERDVIFARITAGADGGPRTRAAAALLLEAMRRTTPPVGRMRSIDLADTAIREKSSSSEKLAVENMLAISRGEKACPLPEGARRPLALLLAEAAEQAGLDGPELERLGGGLDVLREAVVQFSSDDADAIAVPLSLPPGDPAQLVAVLDEPAIAAALDLALDAAPPAHWAVEAMLGHLLKPAVSRHPVGGEVLRLVDEARARDTLREE